MGINVESKMCSKILQLPALLLTASPPALPSTPVPTPSPSSAILRLNSSTCFFPAALPSSSMQASNIGRFLPGNQRIFLIYVSRLGWIRCNRSDDGFYINTQGVKKIIVRYLREPRVWDCKQTFKSSIPPTRPDHNACQSDDVRRHRYRRNRPI